jgi:Na+-transporting NADH:ubiquinone oxidoreductase subunit NqrB
MNTASSALDPRLYQITVLSVLVTFGVVELNFGIHWYNAVAILLAAQATQYLGTRLTGLPSFDPKSAMVTSLSLTLLLRTDSVALAALAAAIAIGSKFLIRIRGKHVFNPANVAIVTLMLASDQVWISTGQWGNAALGAFLLACLGLLVLTRARRAGTTIAFLGTYAALLIGRAAWLGDPLQIPFHHLQNGALLIFAFFMISDPKTTPNIAACRVAYGAIVAVVTATIQFVFYQPNAAVLALLLAAPLVPVFDAVFRGAVYRWVQPSPVISPQKTKGVFR